MTLPRHSVSPPGQVIVGVDGSPNSMAALRRALGQAAGRGAGVEMIYVIPADAELAAVGAGYAMLGAAVCCVAASGLCVHQVKQHVARGDPAEVLVKRSVGAQMLVIGGRFHAGYSGNLLGGDVVPYVLEHAACPVDICADQRTPESAAQPASES